MALYLERQDLGFGGWSFITREPQASLTLLWDLLPGVGRVHEGGVLDLVVDVLVLVEGKRPAQADVDDDAHRPHVQRAVVAFVPQDFGSEIRRRADHRTPKRLLADDPSETEVTQLHLKQECDQLHLKSDFYLDYF